MADASSCLSDISRVLELRGETTLAEAYREAWAFSQAGWTEFFGYPPELSPTLFRCLDGSEWGMLSMYGFIELADGTIRLPSRDVRQPAFGTSTPKEHISSEADLVPAARRLLKRILDGVPGVLETVAVKLSLRGFDPSGLVLGEDQDGERGAEEPPADKPR